MQLSFLGSEIWTGLRRNVSMTVSVILVTMVSVYLLGLGMLAQRQADTMKGYWYDRIQVSIYLCTDTSAIPNCQGQGVTQEQTDTLKAQLEAMPEVKEVFYESEEDAYARFQEQFKDKSVADSVKVGDIPPSLRVQLKDPNQFEVITSQFDGAPGVALVQDQQKVLEKFFAVINGITAFALTLAVLMVVAAVLLMATTIRQSAFSRRREIGIMRLVGASNMTVRGPFIIETVIAALAGALIAIGMLWATAHFLISKAVSDIVRDQALIGSGDVWAITPVVLLGVAGLAVATGVVTLWRYLRV